jgi:tetratricopeptide (TPR) repeat protein
MSFTSGLKHFCVGALVATVVFCLVEAFLRLAGMGFPPSFFIDRAGGYSVINFRFGRLFYPEELVRGAYPAKFRTVKDPDTFRVFVLGESAAAGFPDPAFSASRILSAKLRRACPERSFEVINTGVTAMNSHAVRLIAKELARYQPDAVIIYMGNNEVVGPFGPGSVLGGSVPSLAMARALIGFRSTRLGQALQSCVDVLLRAARPAGWGGMEMFVSEQVKPDDAALDVVYRNFTANLHEILADFQARAIPVILCTVASNLTGCPPLGAVSADDHNHAEAAYQEGLASLRSGSTEQGMALLRFARDADQLRFRADSVINKTIRQAGIQNGCVLLDVEDVFAKQQAQDVSGSDPVFYEHVHFTFAGNVLLSKLWFRALGSLFARQMPCLGDVELLAREDMSFVADSLGYTALARGYSVASILRLLERPPFNTQSGHPERIAYWRGQLRAIDRQLTPDYVSQCISRLEHQARAEPEDGSLNYWLGRHHEDRGDLTAASVYYERSLQALPDNPEALAALAETYQRQGRRAEALTAYQNLLRILPMDQVFRAKVLQLQSGSAE